MPWAATPSVPIPSTSTPRPCRTSSAGGLRRPAASGNRGLARPGQPDRQDRCRARGRLSRRAAALQDHHAQDHNHRAALRGGPHPCERTVLARLTAGLDREQAVRLEQLLDIGPDAARTWLGWLRQPTRAAGAAAFQATIERLL